MGFVRTDQLERTIDKETGELVDLSLIKIIGPIKNLRLADGSPFPFIPSTPLYPEWNIASLPQVTDDVNREVQTSLLQLADKVMFASDLLENCDESECGPNQTLATCFEECSVSILPCDTSAEVALAASVASTKGKFSGWRTTLSYMPVRNMQHEIDFLSDEATGRFQCARAKNVADAVVCPPGHFKREPEDIETSCEQAGLDCYGFQCLCSPCVQAYDVDFAPVLSGERGCPKFSVCGSVEQTKRIQFRAIDNKKRSNSTISVAVLDGGTASRALPPVSDVDSSPYQYLFEYDAIDQPVGVVVIEVSVDGEQISESPFRLEITERDCAEDTGNVLKVPNEFGDCACDAGTVSFGTRCTRMSVLLPSIFVPLLAILGVVVNAYVQKKRRQAQSIWKIEPEELIFEERPMILGRGTFGMVIQADFRGTPVAVKRVLPPVTTPKTSGAQERLSRRSSRRSLRGLKQSGIEQSLDQDELFSDDEFRPEDGGSGSFRAADSGSGSFMSRCSDNNGGSFMSKGSRRDGLKPSHSGRKDGFFSKSVRSLSSGLAGDESQPPDYDQMKKEFISEMSLLSKLRHPSITTVMGAVIATGTEPMMVMVRPFSAACSPN